MSWSFIESMNFCQRDLNYKEICEMYIIELLIKIFTHKKEKPMYDPLSESPMQDYEVCEHTFMPIDSTNETLSCTKCGILVKRSELKNKNFFIQ